MAGQYHYPVPLKQAFPFFMKIEVCGDIMLETFGGQPIDNVKICAK